ncbi:MAG: hypothetical protein NT062_21850 [Proteobacteria bacterium]|nr:hypothetical protein [Pseudomonadota bacterium]
MAKPVTPPPPTVRIKPNAKCCNCQHYVDERCRERSVPRFCGARYLKIA